MVLNYSYHNFLGQKVIKIHLHTLLEICKKIMQQHNVARSWEKQLFGFLAICNVHLNGVVIYFSIYIYSKKWGHIQGHVLYSGDLTKSWAMGSHQWPNGSYCSLGFWVGAVAALHTYASCNRHGSSLLTYLHRFSLRVTCRRRSSFLQPCSIIAVSVCQELPLYPPCKAVPCGWHLCTWNIYLLGVHPLVIHTSINSHPE